MPKFYRQNKKSINPRYFLNETIEKVEEQDAGLTASDLSEPVKGAVKRLNRGDSRRSVKKYIKDHYEEKASLNMHPTERKTAIITLTRKALKMAEKQHNKSVKKD